MSRNVTQLLAAMASFSLAACGADVLSPEAGAEAPQYLIGQSALAPISLDRSTDPATLTVPVTLGTNGAKVAARDWFVVSSTVAIWDVTDYDRPLGSVTGEQPIGDAALDAALREGARVNLESPVLLDDITIPPRREVRVVATVTLVQRSSDGSQKVLDSMTRDGMVEPSGK